MFLSSFRPANVIHFERIRSCSLFLSSSRPANVIHLQRIRSCSLFLNCLGLEIVSWVNNLPPLLRSELPIQLPHHDRPVQLAGLDHGRIIIVPGFHDHPGRLIDGLFGPVSCFKNRKNGIAGLLRTADRFDSGVGVGDFGNLAGDRRNSDCAIRESYPILQLKYL